MRGQEEIDGFLEDARQADEVGEALINGWLRRFDEVSAGIKLGDKKKRRYKI